MLVLKILQGHILWVKLYKQPVIHEHKEGNSFKRLAFCNRIEQMIQGEELDPDYISSIYESHRLYKHPRMTTEEIRCPISYPS